VGTLHKDKNIMKDNWKSPLFNELTLNEEESLSGGRSSVQQVQVANGNSVGNGISQTATATIENCCSASAINSRLLTKIDFTELRTLKRFNMGGNQTITQQQQANNNIVGNG
jgi:hypothetical protein